MGDFVKTGAMLLAAFMFLTSGAIAPQAMAQVEETRLGADAFALGTLTPASGSLNRNLWAGAERNGVEDMLLGVPVTFDDPLHLELLRRVTLSPGQGPEGADNALAGRKFLTAARAGFYSQAASLASLVPALQSAPDLAKVVAYAELMDGRTDDACARGGALRDGRTDPFWVKLRFICYVRAGEGSAADLTLDLLRRQDALTGEEYDLYAAFAAGRTPALSPKGPFDMAILRAAEIPLTSTALAAAPLGVLAAVARDEAQPMALRQAALIEAVAAHAINGEEGRRLLDTMPTSALAEALVTVKSYPQGSLEQSEAIGDILRAAKQNWRSFTSMAILLDDMLPAAEPIANYVPDAAEIALAAMVNDQPQVVEKWLQALASNEADPEAATKTEELLNIYARQDISAARRVASSMEVALDPLAIPVFEPHGAGGRAPLASLVTAALDAAEAGSVGPASLVYLMSLEAPQGPVQASISNWVRDRAQLEWLDQEAAFRAAALTYLTGQSPLVSGRIKDGRPLPRLKPARN